MADSAVSAAIRRDMDTLLARGRAAYGISPPGARDQRFGGSPWGWNLNCTSSFLISVRLDPSR